MEPVHPEAPAAGSNVRGHKLEALVGGLAITARFGNLDPLCTLRERQQRVSHMPAVVRPVVAIARSTTAESRRLVKLTFPRRAIVTTVKWSKPSPARRGNKGSGQSNGLLVDEPPNLPHRRQQFFVGVGTPSAARINLFSFVRRVR